MEIKAFLAIQQDLRTSMVLVLELKSKVSNAFQPDLKTMTIANRWKRMKAKTEQPHDWKIKQRRTCKTKKKVTIVSQQDSKIMLANNLMRTKKVKLVLQQD